MHKRAGGTSAGSARDKLLLTIDEAAEALGVGRSLVYILVMRNEIASIKVGRSRRVPLAALRDYVDQQLALAS